MSDDRRSDSVADRPGVCRGRRRSCSWRHHRRLRIQTASLAAGETCVCGSTERAVVYMVAQKKQATVPNYHKIILKTANKAIFFVNFEFAKSIL